MRVVTALLLSASMVLADALDSAVITNTYVVSQEVLKRAWRRQAVFASEGELVDASGTLVSFAESVAQRYAADHIASISISTEGALTNALITLVAHTNEVPDTAYHYAISFVPTESRQNLTAYVVAEESDGTNDIQWVHYNCSLALAPNRVVEYHTSDGVVTPVKVTWVDWSAAGDEIQGVPGCHKCTIARPVKCIGLPCLTQTHDIVGYDGGFGFGSLTVTVDGVLTYTGSVTNGEEIITFDNGVLAQ